MLEIDPPVIDQTEFPLAGSNPETLHELAVREEHTKTETGFRVFVEFDREREYGERKRFLGEKATNWLEWINLIALSIYLYGKPLFFLSL